jgi:hypothetical protein
MVSVQSASGFAAALEKFGETVEEKCTDAIKRFAIKAGEKLIEFSPVAVRPVPRRGLFRGNWRASLLGRNDFPIEYADPIGTQTLAGIARVVNSGPRLLGAWPEIHLSNPHPGAEDIEQRLRVVGRTARDLVYEAVR